MIDISFEYAALKKVLEQFDCVPFKVRFQKEEDFIVGDGIPQFEAIINNPISKAELLTSTSLALGEAYMRKDIEIKGDLFTALNAILGQMDKFTTNFHALDKLLHSATSAKHQKEEVCSHYDIGNDFYSLWLDSTMSYSCGYFENPEDTLSDAQVNKVDHILTKLNLKEGQRLLDIGCGWGYLLIQAAKKYKIQGVGITLSEEQHRKFSERIQDENLGDYLTVKLMDYRDLSKSKMTFDRIVSVGMLEHVGRKNYDLFLKNADSVLRPGGLFLLHYISALQEHPGDPWIKKYIFPGGVIPSLREIISISADHQFFTVDVESLRRHYVKTLLCWRDNFNEQLDQVKLRFDEAFVRMWELYLCSCAATFNNGVIDLHQILLTKGISDELPMTRDYMYK